MTKLLPSMCLAAHLGSASGSDVGGRRHSRSRCARKRRCLVLHGPFSDVARAKAALQSPYITYFGSSVNSITDSIDKAC